MGAGCRRYLENDVLAVHEVARVGAVKLDRVELGEGEGVGGWMGKKQSRTRGIPFEPGEGPCLTQSPLRTPPTDASGVLAG